MFKIFKKTEVENLQKTVVEQYDDIIKNYRGLINGNANNAAVAASAAVGLSALTLCCASKLEDDRAKKVILALGGVGAVFEAVMFFASKRAMNQCVDNYTKCVLDAREIKFIHAMAEIANHASSAADAEPVSTVTESTNTEITESVGEENSDVT